MAINGATLEQRLPDVSGVAEASNASALAEQTEPMETLVQRALVRDSIFLGAKITLCSSQALVTTVVRNLSEGGAMIDCPAGLKKDARIKTHLRNLGEVPGTVMWVNNGRAGVMFDERINPDEVRATPKKTITAALPAHGSARPSLAKGMTVNIMVPGIGSLSAVVDWVDERQMGLSFAP